MKLAWARLCLGRRRLLSEAPADSTETAAAAFEKDKLAFKKNNGKLDTRLYLAKSDCPDGFSSTLRSSSPSLRFGPRKNGDGRVAFLALEPKYRVDGTSRM